MKIKLTPKQAIVEIVKLTKLGMPIYIQGSVGLGKTSVARAVAKEIKAKYWELRCAEIDPFEIAGGMFLDEKTETSRRFPNEILPTKKVVLCLDEITQAQADCESVLLKLVQEGQVGKTKLHKDTIIIATGNAVADRAGCKRMGTALRDRFIFVEIEANAMEWLDWYEAQDDHNVAVAEYIKDNPEMIHQYDPKLEMNQPSPRNWDRLGKVLTATKHPAIIAGIIGEKTAKPFLAFERTLVPMPSVAGVLAGKAKAPVDLMAMERWTDLLVQEFLGGNETNELVTLIANLDVSWVVIALQNIKSSIGAMKLMKDEEAPIYKLFEVHVDAILASQSDN
tara:strand:- start:579 stop:1589 length:1011 start_codon:yes stop_codon:yes gene_type:complete